MSTTCGRIRDGEVLIDPTLAGRVALSAARLHSGEFWPGAHLGLTQRESEVLSLLVAGLSNRAIAAKLVVSEETVKTHSRGIYRKLGVSDRAARRRRGAARGRVPLTGARPGTGSTPSARRSCCPGSSTPSRPAWTCDRMLQGVATLVTETTATDVCFVHLLDEKGRALRLHGATPPFDAPGREDRAGGWARACPAGSPRTASRR